MENPYKGIYYFSGNEILFSTQIIVIKELSEENHAFLRLLTENPARNDISRFLQIYKALEGKADREYAESVLEVFTAANRKWMKQWKGEKDMGPALLEIMEPELKEAERKGREEGMREGIHGTVNVLRSLGLGRSEIKASVMKQYDLTEKEMEKFLK